MKHRYTALPLAVLVLALAAFTGSAFAGGGNGNGSSGSDSHGHSASAPGQTKQAPAAPSTTADNSTGVKPSSTTAHNTTAPASSNKTKQYGNGKTAGQIATKAGYGDATLHGPGNSQPHKYLCGGHEVDVHALAHKGNKCGSKTSQTPTPSASEAATCTTVTRTVTEHVLVAGTAHGQGAEHANAHARKQSKAHYETVTKTESVPTGANCSSSTPTVISTQVVSSTPPAHAVSAGGVAPAIAAATVTPTASASAPAAASTTTTPAAVGAVKGAVMTLKSTKTKPAGGVLGATTRLGHTVAASRLPFTGLPLWIFVIVAATLIAIGVGVRRTASRRI